MPARRKSKFLAGSQAIEGVGSPGGATQETRRITVPASRLEEFALLVEDAFPNARVNEKLITNSGKMGETNIVSFAVIQDDPAGSAQVWYKGSGTLTGAMTSLDW